jgi:hypothetical protein
MIPLAKKATPAAIAALRQATAHFPKRKKASDGLLPSAAHVHQSPNSDHNSGFAVDITHDPAKGIDCTIAYIDLRNDPRVKYLIFQGRIWSKEKGDRDYTGSNKHNKHLHISKRGRSKGFSISRYCCYRRSIAQGTRPKGNRVWTWS